jgi:hypothetical protein
MLDPPLHTRTSCPPMSLLHCPVNQTTVSGLGC